MKKILALGALLLILAGCRINVVNNISADPAITFEILKQEEYGGRAKKSTVVVSSQQQLNELYKELGWNDVPVVDFSNSNVVAIFMGQKNTGGYSISIKKVAIENNTATIQVNTTAPEGMATMALTAPYCIAVIPKTDEIVVKE